MIRKRTNSLARTNSPGSRISSLASRILSRVDSPARTSRRSRSNRAAFERPGLPGLSSSEGLALQFQAIALPTPIQTVTSRTRTPMLDRSLKAEFEDYRKTLPTDEVRQAFDARIERLLSQHGIDYVRGYVGGLKDAVGYHRLVGN